MGRTPCCDKANVKRGPWSPGEDAALLYYIRANGTGGNWIALPHKAGLKRCGKSCRLRWLNYLRPGIKNGGYSEEEENIIYSLYNSIGSRWSVIAAQLPGRTDNDVKNYWNTKLKRKLLAGKTSLNLNNNNNINSHKKIHLSTTNSPASLSEAGNHNDDSWVCSSISSTRAPLQMEVGYTHNITDPQGLVSSPIFSPLWKPTEGSNNNYSVSLSQEVSSISGSSSLALDSNYMLCYDHGSVDDGILMGFSFEPPYDLLHGFGSEEISYELALSPNLGNSPHSSLLANSSDTTP